MVGSLPSIVLLALQISGPSLICGIRSSIRYQISGSSLICFRFRPRSDAFKELPNVVVVVVVVNISLFQLLVQFMKLNYL